MARRSVSGGWPLLQLCRPAPPLSLLHPLPHLLVNCPEIGVGHASRPFVLHLSKFSGREQAARGPPAGFISACVALAMGSLAPPL